jgi:hypothetical protein
LRNDPDFGGANYDKNFKSVKQLIESQGGAEAFKAFSDSDLGNNIPVIKMFAKMAQVFKQDGFLPQDVEGIKGSSDAQGELNRIYGLRGPTRSPTRISISVIQATSRPLGISTI